MLEYLQGAEHLNKKLKKWLYSWTGGRGNFMFDMLEDFMDTFISGLSLFFFQEQKSDLLFI